MKTVVTLNPMGVDVTGLIPTLLRGMLTEPGDEIVPIDYPNQAGTGNIDEGVAALNNQLTQTDGEILVFGYSEGAQVATRWMREYAPEQPTIAPDRMRFILIGNSERKYGGMLYGKEDLSAIADTAGMPDNPPYEVIDFARQYDGFADFPTDSKVHSALDGAAANLGGTDGILNWFQGFSTTETIMDIFGLKSGGTLGFLDGKLLWKDPEEGIGSGDLIEDLGHGVESALERVGAILGGSNGIYDLLRKAVGLISDEVSWHSLANAMAGMLLVHNFYFDVSPWDDDVVTHTERNIKYVTSPTYPIPLLGTGTTITHEERRLRKIIEKAHDRPAKIPLPDYPSNKILWGGPEPSTPLVTGWWAEVHERAGVPGAKLRGAHAVAPVQLTYSASVSPPAAYAHVVGPRDHHAAIHHAITVPRVGATVWESLPRSFLGTAATPPTVIANVAATLPRPVLSTIHRPPTATQHVAATAVPPTYVHAVQRVDVTIEPDPLAVTASTGGLESAHAAAQIRLPAAPASVSAINPDELVSLSLLTTIYVLGEDGTVVALHPDETTSTINIDVERGGGITVTEDGIYVLDAETGAVVVYDGDTQATVVDPPDTGVPGALRQSPTGGRYVGVADRAGIIEFGDNKPNMTLAITGDTGNRVIQAGQLTIDNDVARFDPDTSQVHLPGDGDTVSVDVDRQGVVYASVGENIYRINNIGGAEHESVTYKFTGPGDFEQQLPDWYTPGRDVIDVVAAGAGGGGSIGNRETGSGKDGGNTIVRVGDGKITAAGGAVADYRDEGGDGESLPDFNYEGVTYTGAAGGLREKVQDQDFTGGGDGANPGAGGGGYNSTGGAAGRWVGETINDATGDTINGTVGAGGEGRKSSSSGRTGGAGGDGVVWVTVRHGLREHVFTSITGNYQAITVDHDGRIHAATSEAVTTINNGDDTTKQLPEIDRIADITVTATQLPSL